MSRKPTMSMGFFCSDWLKQGQKVTFLHNNIHKQGYLNLDKDNLWEFVTRDTDDNIISHIELANLQYSLKIQIQENTFNIGWEDNCTCCVFLVPADLCLPCIYILHIHW